MDFEENFTCPICLQLAKDAVESSCCTKIYCSKCIQDIFKKFGHCPCCRNSLMTWHPSKIVRKVISQIKIPCQFCSNKVQSGMMSNHLNKCPKVPITCKLCSARMTQQEIPKHTAIQHQKQAKQYLVSYIIGIKNQRQSKIQQSNIKKQKPQVSLFKPILNRSKLMAKLGKVQKYYCGGQLIGRCKCCDGHCGPDNGQNCDACMQLDIKRFNLDKGYFVNPDGYICQMFQLFGDNRICCFRIIGNKSTGIFSKPVEQTCSVGNCCYACSQIEFSIKIGRYKNIY